MKYTISSLLLLAWTASAATGNGKQCNVKSLRVGKVVTPNTPDLYDQSRAQWASDLGSPSFSDYMLSPDAIVYCDSDMDVVATVAFASRCGYSISVRSGGHQYAGYSSCKKGSGKCIQLDVSNLEVFTHDPATDIVTVGVGLVVEQVVANLVEHELVIPMGICNTVGAGGHFQTSSYGAFARPFGLGMDFMESFRIVTADAQILTVTRDSHPDLWKGVLGGGPGSYGVLLDWTIQGIRSDDYPNSSMTILLAPYRRQIYDVLAPLHMEITALPEHARDFMTYFEIREFNGETVIAITLGWVGVDTPGSFVDGGYYEKLVQPYIDTGLVQVFLDDLRPIHGFMDRTRTDFDYVNPDGTNRYHIHNFHSDKPYTPELLAAIGDEADAYLAIPGVVVSFQFQTWGGTGEGSQYNRNTGLNGYPTRKVFISNDHWAYFPEEDESLDGEVRAIMKNSKQRYSELIADSTEVRHMWLSTDSLTAKTAKLSRDWRKYYPDRQTFEFSQKVKKQYDPDNLFRSDMTVPLP